MTDDSHIPRPLTWRIFRFIVFTLAGLILLTAIFYSVEDWRGWRAWQKYKRESTAQGVTLDWAAYVPPTVPDEENFFKAPNMQSWFVGRGNSPLMTIIWSSSDSYRRNHSLARVVIVPANARVARGDADIVLQYDYPTLTIATDADNSSPPAAATENIPLIVMDGVPLRDAIKALAKQMGMNYRLDVDDRTLSATVSFRLQNVTAENALIGMLREHNLDWFADPQTGSHQIAKMNSNGSVVRADPAVRLQLAKLLSGAVDVAPDGQLQTHLTGATGIEISAVSPLHYKPARIVVRTDRLPDVREIQDFFPDNPLDNKAHAAIPSMGRVSAIADGTNFNIVLDSPGMVGAAEYLERTDEFTNEFASINAASQLPYARMDGDYNDTLRIPIPNFVSVRMLAQMLAQRAQCYMLLQRPESALREVTMIHNLCRMLEARPTGKPMSLVAAMIDVAVNGLYVGTVADGMRLHVWRETELARLQEQLAEVNVLPYLRGSLEFELAFHYHMVDKKSSRQLAEAMVSYRNLTQAEKFKDPTYDFLLFAPHGWVYQNVACGGRLELEMLPNFDLANHLVFPNKLDHQLRATQKAFRHLSPYNYFASQLVPNFTRAIQTAAKNQTLVNEGCIVCALERHRLAHGRYPASLEELEAEFTTKFPADIIGGEPLKYRADGAKFVLYSIGWNERDDGGKPCRIEEANGDLTQNDWVWPYQK